MVGSHSYNATGVLRGAGNVTDMGTYITTGMENGKSTGMGRGNFTTVDGEIANYFTRCGKDRY